MKKVFIVVPCYNEEETIEIYYNEVIKYLTGDYDYNVCFVNDGSKDKSLEIMMSLAEKDKRIKYLSFARNFGKEAAMYAGLEAAKKAKADCAIIMDVDLQDPPYLIPVSWYNPFWALPYNSLQILCTFSSFVRNRRP